MLATSSARLLLPPKFVLAPVPENCWDLERRASRNTDCESSATGGQRVAALPENSRRRRLRRDPGTLRAGRSRLSWRAATGDSEAVSQLIAVVMPRTKRFGDRPRCRARAPYAWRFKGSQDRVIRFDRQHDSARRAKSAEVTPAENVVPRPQSSWIVGRNAKQRPRVLHDHTAGRFYFARAKKQPNYRAGVWLPERRGDLRLNERRRSEKDCRG